MNQDLAKDIDIAYLGTPELSAVVLEDLVTDGFTISGLFCRPDKEKGRGKKVTSCPTKTVAEKHNIPIFQPKNKIELTDQVSKLNPDLMIVFAYGMIVPKEAFEIPKYKTLNIHPSLLPKYRGASPLNWPILNGDKETGVSIIEINDKMDAGHVLSQSKINIEVTDTAKTLGDKLVKLGSKMLTDLLPKWIEGGLKGIAQDDSQATYTRLLTKDDGNIDWSKGALEIERQIRAFTPWPGSYTYWNKQLIKVIEADIEKTDSNYKSGEVFFENKFLKIKTGDCNLIIKRLKLAGKKEVTGYEFTLGHPKMIGSYLK